MLRYVRFLCRTMKCKHLVFIVLVSSTLIYISQRLYTSSRLLNDITNEDLFEAEKVLEIQQQGLIPICKFAADFSGINYTAPLITAYPIDKRKLVCKEKNHFFVYINNGKVKLNTSYVLFNSSMKCSVRAIIWKDDNLAIHHNEESILSVKNPEVVMDFDFLKVECKNEELKKVYHQFIVQTSLRSDIHQRMKKQKEFYNVDATLQPDVLVLMLGHINVTDARHQLPLTSRLLREVFKPLQLFGLNAMGRTMTDNVVPLLTGVHANLITNNTKSKSSKIRKHTIDNLKFIWYDYEHRGYVTLLAEDVAKNAIFNTNHHTGFQRQEPVDHYMRPFWLMNSKDEQCLAGKKKHQYVFDYLNSFFDTYKNNSKFAVYLHHENIEANLPLKYLDKALYKFLLDLHSKGRADNLILMLFGLPMDIGLTNYSNYESYFTSIHLSYAEISLPHWFAQTYPELSTNLIQNSARLITFADIYAFLKDILHAHLVDGFDKMNGESQWKSLLRPFPRNKNCVNSGLPSSWCGCVRSEVISNFDSDDGIMKASSYLLMMLSAKIKPVRVTCVYIEEIKVLYASVFVPKTKETVKKRGDSTSIRQDPHITTYFYNLIFTELQTATPFHAILKYDKISATFSCNFATDLTMLKYSIYDSVICNDELSQFDDFLQLQNMCICSPK